eukprot:9493595-Pyramimonas_sp.AAC.1
MRAKDWQLRALEARCVESRGAASDGRLPANLGLRFRVGRRVCSAVAELGPRDISMFQEIQTKAS